MACDLKILRHRSVPEARLGDLRVLWMGAEDTEAIRLAIGAKVWILHQAGRELGDMSHRRSLAVRWTWEVVRPSLGSTSSRHWGIPSFYAQTVKWKVERKSLSCAPGCGVFGAAILRRSVERV